MKKLVIVMLVLTSFLAQAQDAAFRSKGYNISDGLGIQGYDPVAYFSQGKAVKGSKEHALYHQGVTYHFATAADKELFKKDPSKYEPQYGGWCAYAMGAKGEKVTVDPKTFKITDGKLFLFYNKYFNNTLEGWNKDEGNLKTHADVNWKKITKTP